eukprot:TRINITY_DN49308_c0_g1_i1.p1 TRINITY_DN49308_c0_g1~~TRINITY_DN49308_c0_g1_i1.p1  ORF type:complete len:205 (-),score=17.08 TRINITY_DN49308_c0_g1_i1:491-1057(-)
MATTMVLRRHGGFLHWGGRVRLSLFVCGCMYLHTDLCYRLRLDGSNDMQTETDQCGKTASLEFNAYFKLSLEDDHAKFIYNTEAALDELETFGDLQGMIIKKSHWSNPDNTCLVYEDSDDDYTDVPDYVYHNNLIFRNMTYLRDGVYNASGCLSFTSEAHSDQDESRVYLHTTITKNVKDRVSGGYFE